ncbi:hypothetical protein [Bradyrhizobium sp.]|jgi:hypothetical protein|uniref:hypothetical protein n=1 Tax=Bradyrhizobium sp. TaxID=376 RepID=UPI003C717CE2
MARIFFEATMEAPMAGRRKSSYQPRSLYNSYLAGWAIVASVVLVTLLFIARHLQDEKIQARASSNSGPLIGQQYCPS